tara:strand:- start:54 stop:293 length:240 start_codon:yes stop_codon:yes gene_type:complete
MKPFGSENQNRMTFGSKTDLEKQDFFTPQRKKVEVNDRVGPGSTEYLKPFGSDVHHRMHFGSRSTSKLSETPPPGYYNP